MRNKSNLPRKGNTTQTNNEWNLGEKPKTGLKKETEYAVIVGVVTQDQKEDQVKEYLDELEFLALTAGAVTKKRFTQKLQTPDRRTFVGSGCARGRYQSQRNPQRHTRYGFFGKTSLLFWAWAKHQRAG